MKVFVSSTFYDLIDVRGELAEHLRSIGVTLVMSDDKLSDFRVQPDVNSIQTCLVNVESCDQMILILDQRYGPKLGSVGFEDISATHLEYKHALKSDIPVWVYVRDRLEGDYRVWKSNVKHREDLKLAWVPNRNDWSLFDLLEEHATLKTDKTHSNWYSIFTNSVDLKAALSKSLGPTLLPSRIIEATQNNTFPVFRANAFLESQDNALGFHFTFRVELLNAGGGTAFGFSAYWVDSPEEANVPEDMPPGQKFPVILKGKISTSERIDQTLVAEYSSPLGLLIRDTFNIAIDARFGDKRFGCPLINREYFRSELPRVVIQEPESPTHE